MNWINFCFKFLWLAFCLFLTSFVSFGALISYGTHVLYKKMKKIRSRLRRLNLQRLVVPKIGVHFSFPPYLSSIFYLPSVVMSVCIKWMYDYMFVGVFRYIFVHQRNRSMVQEGWRLHWVGTVFILRCICYILIFV